jgi:hypothetical protein
MNSKLRISISAALGLLLISCSLGAALTPPVTPTPTEAPTATPQPLPTPTVYVDLTPPTPIPSATVDPNSPEYWACKLRSQFPKDGAKFESKERFDMAWQVENFGYGTWEPETIRITYHSGRRLHVNDSVKLKESVPSDTWTQIVVPMVAPRSAGSYTTTWAMWYGDRAFCLMSATIGVK